MKSIGVELLSSMKITLRTSCELVVYNALDSVVMVNFTLNMRQDLYIMENSCDVESFRVVLIGL